MTHFSSSREITVAGVGSGSSAHVTNQVIEAVINSDFIFANSRFKNLIPDFKNFIEIKNFNDAFSKIESLHGKILILVSGDSGVFSLLPLVKQYFQNEFIKVLPGISSLQIISSYASETWNDAKILSGHGRKLNSGKFLNSVERNRITILFCDKIISPKWACENLTCIPDIEVFIGENIGSENEKFFCGSPREFSDREFSELSIILVRNNNFYKPDKFYLRDSDFIREKNIVMTNENVRAVIISKLNFNDSGILWDIGAGSGSVCVSSGHQFPDSEIHAVESNHNAANLISRNISKFHLHNIKLHESKASEIIKTLPIPSHVFIGGSGGELTEILEYISNFNVRVVAACVTLENFNKAYDFMKFMRNFEVVQISVTASKSLNQNLTLMKANNPVMILSADI